MHVGVLNNIRFADMQLQLCKYASAGYLPPTLKYVLCLVPKLAKLHLYLIPTVPTTLLKSTYLKQSNVSDNHGLHALLLAHAYLQIMLHL